MLIVVSLIIAAVFHVSHAAHRTRPRLSDKAIATALGWLVRDGAVNVEAGRIHATGVPLDERRGPIEARTLATIREVDHRSGALPVEQLFAAVRQSRA